MSNFWDNANEGKKKIQVGVVPLGLVFSFSLMNTRMDS